MCTEKCRIQTEHLFLLYQWTGIVVFFFQRLERIYFCCCFFQRNIYHETTHTMYIFVLQMKLCQKSSPLKLSKSILSCNGNNIIFSLKELVMALNLEVFKQMNSFKISQLLCRFQRRSYINIKSLLSYKRWVRIIVSVFKS